MTWVNGGQGSHIPDAVKRVVRARQGNRCNIYHPDVCTGQLNEFDHIINIKTLKVERRLANDITNIQGLCEPCHKAKTQTEAQQAKHRHLRPRQPHPSD